MLPIAPEPPTRFSSSLLESQVLVHSSATGLAEEAVTQGSVGCGMRTRNKEFTAIGFSLPDLLLIMSELELKLESR